jgi:large subunit ribosomal protein L4
LSKKVKRLARVSAFATKAKDESVKLIENFTIENSKTKEMFTVLRGMELDSDKVLMLIPSQDIQILRASRNIPNLQVRVAETASTYDIMNCRTLLIQESALEKLEGSLAS